jgi:hypothetical protein
MKMRLLFYTIRIFRWQMAMVIISGFLLLGQGVRSEVHLNSSPIAPSSDSLEVEFYPIPSPDEILEYIDVNSLHYRESILNNLKNVDLYNTSYEKKIGFGLYMADLAYALSFEQTGTVMNYFGTIEGLGRELNLFPSEIGAISERFITNINRHDSLKNLYTESYILMIDHLDETSNIGSYAIISAGSFIESIYLALNSLNPDAENDAYKIRIWGQKLVFEQLMKIADHHLDKPLQERFYKDLAGLKRVFDTYSERPKPTTTQVKDNGNIVLGKADQKDGKKPASLTELRKEIDILRRKWVKR